MKRIVAAMAAGVLALGMAAYANATTLTPDISKAGGATVDVELNLAEAPDDYKLNIPDTMTFTEADYNSNYGYRLGEVKLEITLLNETHGLNVTFSSGNDQGQGFELKGEHLSTKYWLEARSGQSYVGTTWRQNADASATPLISIPKEQTPKPSVVSRILWLKMDGINVEGTYTDKLTFTVEVLGAEAAG